MEGVGLGAGGWRLGRAEKRSDEELEFFSDENSVSVDTETSNVGDLGFGDWGIDLEYHIPKRGAERRQ